MQDLSNLPNWHLMTTSAEPERSNNCFSSPDYKSGGKRLLRQQRERREVTATETESGTAKWKKKKKKNAVYFKMYGGAAESGLAFTESFAEEEGGEGAAASHTPLLQRFTLKNPLQNPLRGATHID